MKKSVWTIFFILAWVSCNFRFSKVYSVPPCTLNHWDSATMSFPHNRWGNEFSFRTSSSYEDIVMIAPVNLTHGASVRKLTTYVTDNTDEDEARMLIILGRQNLLTGEREQMASLSTNACSASPDRRELAVSTISLAKIDNEKYTYHLDVIFGRQNPNLKFHGATIHY